MVRLGDVAMWLRTCYELPLKRGHGSEPKSWRNSVGKLEVRKSLCRKYLHGVRDHAFNSHYSRHQWREVECQGNNYIEGETK